MATSLELSTWQLLEACDLPSIRTISPTQLEVARSCRLRFVFGKARGLSTEYVLPSSYPDRWVGKAFHKLVERVRLGQVTLGEAAQADDDAWSAAVEHAERAASAGPDRVWVPLHNTVPRFEQYRLRALKTATAQVGSRSHRTGASSGNQRRTEAEFADESDTVVGRVDAIEGVGENIFLVDYKSGRAVNQSGVLRANYVEQLLIYAALHRESRGTWPVGLKIIDGFGGVHEVEVERQRSLELLAECLQILGTVQEVFRCEDAISIEELHGLAKVADVDCLDCEYRPACPVYRTFLDGIGIVKRAEYRLQRIDVSGRVAEARVGTSGRGSIVIETDCGIVTLMVNLPSTTDGHQCTRVELEDLSGRQVRAFGLSTDLRAESPPFPARMRIESRVYTVS